MDIIEKSNYYGYPKNKMWYAVEFNIVNPTTSPYTVDLFNGYNQVPIQTIPSAISNPTILNGNISVGSFPDAIAYNPINNCIYVCNSGDNTVSVITCLTNAVISIINVGTTPTDIAYSSLNNCMYCCNYGSDSISVIDCSSNLITNTINVLTPYGICYNSINNSMYVPNQGGNFIYIINCVNNSFITIPSSGFFYNTGDIAFDPDNNFMYICNFGSDNISVLNCNTNNIITTIPAISNPKSIAYNSVNKSMYACCSGSDNVIVISCTLVSVVDTISVPVLPYAICYFQDLNYMYICTSGSDSVSIMDCSSNSIIGSPILVGSSPVGISYNIIDNSMYISNTASDNLSVLVSATSPTFYITGSTNYNQFVRELQNIPKRARQMRLIVDNSNQLSVPLDILKRDANGNFCNTPKIPTEYRDANNYQGSICDIPFEPKELILNNQMIISQYTIAPNSTVKMVLYFDEIDMSDLLSEKLNVYNQIETKVEDLNTISEDTLEVRYDDRPSVKPDWLKNFKSGKSIKI